MLKHRLWFPRLRFLGSLDHRCFTQEKLRKASLVASGRVVGVWGDPGSEKLTEGEKEALADVLDAMGLVPVADPRKGMGGKTVNALTRPSA